MYQSLFDLQLRLDKIDLNGDPLSSLNKVIDWEIFRPDLEIPKTVEAKSAAGRKPYDRILLFKMLIIQSLYNLSDDQLEQQTLDRLSFHRFLGLNFGDRVPDAKTIWAFRELLNQADRARKIFDKFNNYLHSQGFRAQKGQIIDASIVKVPIQRNSRDENRAIKNGSAAEAAAGWSDAKKSQKDIEARWTKKNGQSYFGYKNHISVDVKHKIIREYAVSPANVHDSEIFLELLDVRNSNPSVYADSAYTSEKHISTLSNLGFRECLHRRAYRNQEISLVTAVFNSAQSAIRCRVEHVFGAMRQKAGNLILRTIGLARAETKIALRNVAYNLSRVTYLTLNGKSVA